MSQDVRSHKPCAIAEQVSKLVKDYFSQFILYLMLLRGFKRFKGHITGNV